MDLQISEAGSVRPDESLRRMWIAAYEGEPRRAASHVAPIVLPVLTGSMRPLLPVGSEIEIQIASGSRCRAGDVIVFRDGPRLTVHRLLLSLHWGDEHLLLQKGDNARAGAWIRAEDVVGRTVRVTDRDGVSTDLRSPSARWSAWLRAGRELFRHFRAVIERCTKEIRGGRNGG